MNENKQENQPEPTKTAEKRPDDCGSVSVEGLVKIFDPNSRKVFVEQQA
jgi:hypothetical protein